MPTVQANITCSSARIRVPFHRTDQTATICTIHHRLEPAMEELLVAVLARAVYHLVEALIARLIRAFLATPAPARP